MRNKAARKVGDERIEVFWEIQVHQMGEMKTGPENRKRLGTNSGYVQTQQRGDFTGCTAALHPEEKEDM